MLYATTTFGESFLYFVLFFSIGMWSIKRLLGRVDPNGEVKKAATGKVIGTLVRWLK